MMPIMIAVFGLLLASQFFLTKNKQNTPPATQQTQAVKAPEASPAAAPAVVPQEPASASAAPASTTPVAAAAAETETVVENDLYRIVFTNRGAQAKHWILKKYKDDRGQPLDLVNAASANLGLPLSLYTYDEALRNKINSALYVASASGTVAVPGELTFEFSDGTVAVHKTFRFDNSYVVGVETKVTVGGEPVQAYPVMARRLWGPGHRPILCFSSHRLFGWGQHRAPCCQEDQWRQYSARTLPVGRTTGPVFRGHLPARPTGASRNGHLPQHHRGSERSCETRSKQSDQGRNPRRGRR